MSLICWNAFSDDLRILWRAANLHNIWRSHHLRHWCFYKLLLIIHIIMLNSRCYWWMVLGFVEHKVFFTMERHRNILYILTVESFNLISRRIHCEIIYIIICIVLLCQLNIHHSVTLVLSWHLLLNKVVLVLGEVHWEFFLLVQMSHFVIDQVIPSICYEFIDLFFAVMPLISQVLSRCKSPLESLLLTASMS